MLDYKSTTIGVAVAKMLRFNRSVRNLSVLPKSATRSTCGGSCVRGQELSLQLEKEKHADRLNELKDEVDHLLEKLTYETTISNWPLKVLPIMTHQ